MSLILDALRKSERSRQQSLSGQLGTSDAKPGAGRVPVPWTTLLGLLLAVNAVVLGVLFWRGGTPPPAPAAQPAPAETALAPAASYHPSVRSLAQEAGAPAVASAASVPVAVTAQPPPTAPPEAIVAGNVPELASLPASFQQSLPALHLDVLGYAAQRADRFVVINLHRYHIGDTLAEGPELVDIEPGGAVLQYTGTRFLLPP